jgi:hypothetical protein
MESEALNADSPKRKRHWLQFSLRSLLLFTLLCAVASAWVAHKMKQKRREREAIGAVVKLSGSVLYDYQNVYGAKPHGPDWLRRVVGDDFFSEVDHVVLTGSNAGDAELERLEVLAGIHTLWLGGTKVSDAGVEHIKEFRELRQLGLLATNISNAGLGRLKELTQLQTLDLRKTRVTDTGVTDLQKALPNCKIERQE